MNERVTKKLTTPFASTQPTAAVLMVNLYDPQIRTTKIFLEAIESSRLPYLVLGNKADLVEEQEISKIRQELSVELLPVSFVNQRNIADLSGLLKANFAEGARIVVLGIFNTGKTSLIAHLTGESLNISNMPGTTLSFEEHAWENRVLIDSVGQLIDVNRPLMVGFDFEGLSDPVEMFDHALRQEAEGVLSSIQTARAGFIEALTGLRERIGRGGKVVITGAGASALVAEEIAGQFYETGVMAYPVTNSLSQALPVSFAKGVAEQEGGLARYVANCVGPKDVLIGVSASGGTGFVYEALRRGRERGALTIALTENKDTPLGVNADIIIKSNAKPEGPSSTRIQTAHLAIGHALVCVLAALRGLTGDESVAYMMPEPIATKKMGIK